MAMSGSTRMAAVLALALTASSTATFLPQLAAGARPEPTTGAARARQTQSEPVPGANPTPGVAAPVITLLDTASATLVVKDSTLSGTLLFSNPTSIGCLPDGRGGVKPNAELRILLRSSRWRSLPTVKPLHVCVPPGVSMVPFEAAVSASLSDYPLIGAVVLQEIEENTATPGTWAPRTGTKPISLTLTSVARDDSGAVDWQILRSAGIAALVGVLAAGVALVIRLRSGALATPMGAAGSSLADGWSAALIVGGPFLMTAFALGGFPDYPATMTKKAYIVTSFVISVIIGVAPNIYGLYRAPTRVQDGAAKLTIQNQGISGLFLASAWFTLTGCLAQVALLQLFFRDLSAAGLLSAPAGSAVDRVLWLLWFAVAIYGPIAAFNTVVSQHTLQVAVPPPAAPMGGAAAPLAPQRLPDWAVL
jgi:hypothetical protein